MKNVLNVFKALLLIVVSAQFAWADVSDNASFTKALVGKKTSEKESAIDWLLASQPEGVAKPLLTSWLNGTLYYVSDRKNEHYQQLYVIQGIKTATQAQSAWNYETLAIESSKQFKKVRVNNKLRGILRVEIASMGLNSDDAKVRYQSVNNLLSSKDIAIIERIEQMLPNEPDGDVGFDGIAVGSSYIFRYSR